ncbi:conserved hypothetical protein [uncultured Pleomorphomonas sp.]|uniref:Portal protein n=1 Tax=uncultured Pleomorphomonas sp. TaxID=442121 RepID=A0A212L234_9HYPH|nr:hypothetical protein [uncultured Pleomorphomonas sp.]SCM71547.1 conserved hypothetical protein [uncultured Pleomorphomonas sp.]
MARRPAAASPAQPLRFDPSTIGSTGLRQTGGYLHEEFLRDLRGEKGMRKYREMTDNDYVIGAMLFAIQTLIAGVEWTMQAVDETTEAEDAATFAEEVLGDMKTPWPSALSEICTMFPFGYAPMEVTWKKRTDAPNDIGLPSSKYTDGKIGVDAISLRAQETVIRWDIDDIDGTIRGFWQQPINRPMAYIPISKCLLFRTSAVKNNPEGRSILRNAYRSWYFKTRMEEIEAIGVERDLAGLPMMRIPAQLMAEDATPQDKAVFKAYQKLVTNVRRDQQEGIILPSSKDKEGNYLFDFELLTTGGSRAFDTNKVLTRYDRAIATSVLADFIFLGQQAVGSFALSSDKTALFGAAIQSFLENVIAAQINTELLPRLWFLNALPPELMPVWTPGAIEEASLAEVAQLISSMTGAGAPMFPDRDLENHLRKRAGLPPAPEEGEDMRTPDMPDDQGTGSEDDEEVDDGLDDESATA